MIEDIVIHPNEKAERAPFDWGELTWFASGGQGNADDMTVGRCILKAGAANPRHRHPNCAEILVVQKGRIRHTGPGGAERELGPGDTATIPPNVWHQARNVGEGEAVLFIAFSSANRQTESEN